MKSISLIIIAVVGVLLVSGFFVYRNGVARNSAVAQCLTAQGAVMYGTEWCSHCQAQKSMFGDAFKNIVFVDCDLNKDKCDQEGVASYPTWKIRGQTVTGTQEVATLAQMAGCTQSAA